MLAISVITYNFNIVQRNLVEVKILDIKVRKMKGRHHPKANIHRPYLPRSNRGRILTQLELSYKKLAIGLFWYSNLSDDWMLQKASKHKKEKILHSVVKEARGFAGEIDLDLYSEYDGEMKNTENARKLKRIANEKGKKVIDTVWKSKLLHSQYQLWSWNADVDLHDTHQWLRIAWLKAETEGFIVAAQDQSLFTRTFQANVLHNGADPRRRFCNTSTEYTDHLISVGTIHAQNEYTNRYNRVGQYRHWKIRNHDDIEIPNKWYKYNPLPVVDIPKMTILRDFPIRTDRTIQANRTDILIKHKQNKTSQLRDMSVPSDGNISAKESERLRRHKDLEIEIAKMWKMKTKVLPVIVGALGIIKKGMQKYVNEIPGNLSLAEIQKLV